uniref:Putative RNA-directed DNA polymerase, eukaryota, reverse transcriptase zinc-binding domain protein n=1 Tax=Tanacetum cinerariifolium TaxID=118510 RepID=A0A6L2K820_TANCI|nr:putative RNA-directed DNA polymerase, eukaryota, reverse transcriptase zinc-binding domain protein [Tanacetum cinerariifolium]
MLIFKVDFKKAFDSVSWKYLDFMLHNLGFSLTWRAWIKACLYSSRTSILANGSLTLEFLVKRGLRQGDLLSPLLFIIVMEGLHMSLMETYQSVLINDVKIGSLGITLSHMFYADDVVITADWNPIDMKNIFRILYIFYLASTLKINIHKSNGYGVGVTDNEVNLMASSTGCSLGTFPFTYLGLPVGANMDLFVNWNTLYDRFDARLSKWKANLLSIGGCLTLIRYVLRSLGIYYFSIFKVPEVVLKMLEKKRATFFTEALMTFVNYLRLIGLTFLLLMTKLLKLFMVKRVVLVLMLSLRMVYGPILCDLLIFFTQMLFSLVTPLDFVLAVVLLFDFGKICGQPLPVAPAADSEANVLAEWNGLYDAYNEMKGYVDQLECLGYMLPQDLIVSLILNGLTKDFARFVRNYNTHNMRKMMGELHAMIIEYEKGLPKKAETPQVMMIKGGKIQNSKKNCLKLKEKVKLMAREMINMFIPLSLKTLNLLLKSTQLRMTSATIARRTKLNLNSTYLWHYRLAHISKKRIEKLQQEGILRSIDDESFDQHVSCLSGKMTRKSFSHRPKRATGLLRIIHTDVCGLLRHVSRQGAIYFITLTDDYSHYGYVYLLKHKHEDYALESATHILNMVPTKKVDKTPYKLWYGKVPNFSYLKVWGCEVLVKQDTPDKLQQRSVKCIFIEFPKETIGYYFYFPSENKIVVARYVEFFEINLITQEVSGRAVNLKEIQDEDTSPSEITSKIPMEDEGFEPPQEEVIPIHNMIWVLVDLPPNCKTVGSKWIFKKKTDMDDVKTAFLNGYLDEDIYMVQPKGFVDPNHPRKVCKLQRSIYGLKQASRNCNKRFDEEIKKFGFAQNLDEPCVYQKASGSNVAFLILYIDEIIIMGNHIPSLQSVKDCLRKCLAMKDLGEVAFILGIKIYRDRLDLNNTQGALTPKEVKRMQNVPYASANPGKCHWTAMKNILKYLRNTKDMFLVYGGNPKDELRFDYYCDAGFKTDRDDTKSQTGYVLILNRGTVDWKSSNERVIICLRNQLSKIFALFYSKDDVKRHGAGVRSKRGDAAKIVSDDVKASSVGVDGDADMTKKVDVIVDWDKLVLPLSIQPDVGH